MDAPQGLDDIRPRTAVLVGSLSLVVFILTIVPDPITVLQLLSAIAGIGSFVLAFLNHGSDRADESSQEVAAHGRGPTQVLQVMDSEITVDPSRKREQHETEEGEELEERN
jgi:hypothetical protein